MKVIILLLGATAPLLPSVPEALENMTSSGKMIVLVSNKRAAVAKWRKWVKAEFSLTTRVEATEEGFTLKTEACS